MPIAVFGVHGYQAPPSGVGALGGGGGLIDHPQAAPPSLDANTKPPQSLAGPQRPQQRRELSSHQLRTLLNASNLKGKQLIALMLSGLSLDEAVWLSDWNGKLLKSVL